MIIFIAEISSCAQSWKGFISSEMESIIEEISMENYASNGKTEKIIRKVAFNSHFPARGWLCEQ